MILEWFVNWKARRAAEKARRQLLKDFASIQQSGDFSILEHYPNLTANTEVKCEVLNYSYDIETEFEKSVFENNLKIQEAMSKKAELASKEEKKDEPKE